MDADIYERHEARPSFQLHHSMKDRSLHEREAAVKRGVKRLAILRGLLHRSGKDGLNSNQWNDQINKALNQASQKRAIIGVVGNTGAGKTSLINAILGEGQLLPTNCMRACTATVTEIAYNKSLSNYIAEIEYINFEEWKQELELGWRILFDQSGRIVRDATSDGTDANIFYAKMKAVYTDLTRDDLQLITVDELMKHPSMSILGSIEKIEEESAASFSRRLQLIIDSKEHSDGQDPARRPAIKRRANWPLIRKAKVFVKSTALSTGVTLVDLPGVQDSNPARARIATEYLRECSGLLVATPIHRAVDDKIASNLLGKSFKRQIMMDGGFNTVTFVCTKADDISVTEASYSPTIEHRINLLTIEANDCYGAIANLKEEIAKLDTLKRTAEVDIQSAYEMQDRLEDTGLGNGNPAGNKDSPFSSPGSKRKGHEITPSPDKKRQATGIDVDHDGTRNGSDLNAALDSPDKDEVARWRRSRKELQQHRQDIVQKLAALTNELHVKEAFAAGIESRKVSVCIAERSQYVEAALKRDFVAGVKEFDQERLGHDGEVNANATITHRDYRKLRDELPVFCVSAKAFQMKLGRLEHEPEIAGFATKDDTGIPKLQDHCKQLTDAGRAKSADYFLAMFSGLMNSLSLWVTNDLGGAALTDAQRVALTQVLQQELSMLKSILIRVVADVCSELKDRIKNHIYKALEPAWINAKNEAGDKAKGWGQLAHQTWRAVCVRNGSFENGNGKYDWNEELVEPILEYLAPKWETTFSDLSNKTFRKFKISSRKAVKDFHRLVPELFQNAGSKTPQSHRLLEAQLESYRHAFEVIEDFGKDLIGSQQRMISRAFKPIIRDSMTSAYKQCLEETGSGSWKRMKEHMVNHISSRPGMFRDSTKAVQTQLDELIKTVRHHMTEKILVVYEDIHNDYINTLVGGGGNATGAGADAEDHTRSALVEELLVFIDGTERDFNEFSEQFQSGHFPDDDLGDYGQGAGMDFFGQSTMHSSGTFDDANAISQHMIDIEDGYVPDEYEATDNAHRVDSEDDLTALSTNPTLAPYEESLARLQFE